MKSVLAYSPEYKEKCKQAWYLAGCPTSSKDWAEHTPEADDGRKPALMILRKWRKEEEWDLWAQSMDVRVSEQVEDDIVSKKVEMFKRHAQQALDLVLAGTDYLYEKGMDNSASAVNAIVKGIQLERESVGGAEMTVRLASMSNTEVVDELKKELQKAIDSGELEQVINIELDDEENTTSIDADSK
jgi:hypothetical protein